MEYLELARTYLQCKEPRLSLKCLSYAKEFRLCGQLSERLGKVRPAGRAAPGRTVLPAGGWGRAGVAPLPLSASGRGCRPPESAAGPGAASIALLSPHAQVFRWLSSLCVYMCMYFFWCV